ncbi:uncharacterized protein [Venturia canescens]|uniref:uncharacterized protein n=1 Tax=Venturia canescens TaxID=32260 RepID=UPI001C9CF579|nr:uncharacterized protein LOC122419263 [Venturia canescens]
MLTQKIVFVLPLLIVLTGSIPVFENGANNTNETLETREEMMTRYRLPNNSVPRLYRIKIEPNMEDETLTWAGESNIDLEVLTVTKIITLHAYENLVINENFTNVVVSTGEKYEPIEHVRDSEVEFLNIVFDQDIPVGNHTLNIKYHGTDPEEFTGFYKSAAFPSFSVAATHFEATTARRAFPCWDEPGLKARYRMSIKHYPNYTAISNMPAIEAINTGDEKIVTKFDTTPVMSVYLLTFVISDYESVSNEFGNITVWAGKTDLDAYTHILNTSQKVVDFMEEYTGLSFGFPRIGSVVIPMYTSSATEHWGLVSYSSRTVRFDPSTHTTVSLDRINLLIAHELAHSWFGNRVTPLWWDDLWLNEAFASYFQYIIMADINRYSDGLGLFVVRNNQEIAFSLDTLEHEIYIRWKPVTNREIRKLFGRITYRKGAAIVHMFHSALTTEVFQSGIRKYLSKHSYQAVEADNLMAALQEAYDENNNGKAPLNVKETMMTWLMQTGGPVLTVTRNYTTGDTKVEQRSVLAQDTAKKWWIPLNYATMSNPNFSSTSPSRWMSDKEENLTINGIDKNDWVIFNIQASGYYRVYYDDENWKRIVEYMNTENYKNIHVINRAQLINDLYTFSQPEPFRSGKRFWQLTKYLSRETEYLPWSAAMNIFEVLDQPYGTGIQRTFQKYILGLMNNFIEKVGYETRDDDDYVTKLSKKNIVERACLWGHAGCSSYSSQRLLEYIDKPLENRIHTDSQTAMICAGLRGLNETTAKYVIDSAFADETLLMNLGCTENHEIHRNYLNTLMENSTEDYLRRAAFRNLYAGSDENFNFVIDFFLEKFPTMIKNDTKNFWDSPISSMIIDAIPLITSPARLEKFQKILDLDIFDENKGMSRSKLMSSAQRTIADAEVFVTNFLRIFDEHLLPDNLLHDTNIETGTTNLTMIKKIINYNQIMNSPKQRGCFTLFLLLLLMHTEGSAAADNNKTEKYETPQYSLSNVSVPISYDIKLVPEIIENNFTFYGETMIVVAIKEPTRNLTMHSKDLRIDENFTSLFDSDKKEYKPTKHTYENTTDFLIIEFNKLLAAGTYNLNFKYAGNMSKVPEGIFNSSYTDEKGDKVWLVATKFTQLHARRAFPCWDEPHFKATFALSVKHDTNYTAVSNMPASKKHVDSDGKQWTTFATTPIMSTYLLAFVVSDFDCLRDESEKFNVCGRKGVLPYLKHSWDVSHRALELLEKYMDLKYIIPKMDQYAVPDATTGATENWGLIIYRESSFAYEPFQQPVSGKLYVTQTVVHELAHQWIGNLVTPVTWKYSWIIEGLPTFLQYCIVDMLFPDWKQMDLFVTRIIQDTTFNFDESIYYNALEWSSENPADIRKKFSPQIYNRGAAIFHMMSNILTQSTFKAGVVKFVHQNQYKCITSDDLWNAMQTAHNEKEKDLSKILSIKEIMKGWVEQQGYPVVNVTRDYETGKVVIRQEGNLEKHKSNRWWIPINFATKSDLNFDSLTPTHWLKPGDESLVLEGIDKDDWIIVNVQQSGYYRVNYDTQNWKRIAQWMNNGSYGKIPVSNRAQLINDLSYMVKTKRENYTTFLDLIRYLIHEDDYQPWLPTFRAIRELRRSMYDEQVDQELKKFVLTLMEKVINKIGFEDRSKYEWMKIYKPYYDKLDNKTKKFVPTEKALEKIYKSEDFLTRRFRPKFLSFACNFGHKKCKDSASAQFQANIENPTENPISPDLVGWVNCYGADRFEDELMKSINGSDTKYVGYLGCSQNKTVLQKYVNKVLHGELNATIRQAQIAIGYLCEDGAENFDRALNYFIENFDIIYKHFAKEPSDQKASSAVSNPALSILHDYIWKTRTHEQMKKIGDFMAKEKSRIPARIEDSITEQTKKIQWSEENAPILGEWLHDYSLNKSE